MFIFRNSLFVFDEMINRRKTVENHYLLMENKQCFFILTSFHGLSQVAILSADATNKEKGTTNIDEWVSADPTKPKIVLFSEGKVKYKN